MKRYNSSLCVSVCFFCLLSCAKTPIKLFEDYSGIRLPLESKVSQQVHLENERGEKVIFIKILIENEVFWELNESSIREDYKELPINEPLLPPEQHGVEILSYLSEKLQSNFYIPDIDKRINEGYYKLKMTSEGRSYDLIILDKKNKILILYSLTL